MKGGSCGLCQIPSYTAVTSNEAHACMQAQFKSKPLDTDDKFTFTLTTPGTYEYFCSLHPHMTGTIVVKAATGAGATP
jgi:plastocyanin